MHNVFSGGILAHRYAMIENIFRVELGGNLYVLVKRKWFPAFNKVTKERFAKSRYGLLEVNISIKIFKTFYLINRLAEPI